MTHAAQRGQAQAPGVEPRVVPAEARVSPTGRSALLHLQQQAGNRAVAEAVVQRVHGPVLPKATLPQFQNVTSTLSNLQPHLAGLQVIAANPGLVKDLALRYGFEKLGHGAPEMFRSKQVEPHYKPLYDAARAVHDEVPGSADTVTALEGGFHAGDLKKRMKAAGLVAVFDLAVVAWQQEKATYGKQPAGYEVMQGRVQNPLAPLAEAKSVVLPARDVVNLAVGPVGVELKALTGAALNGQAITTVEVDRLYTAYNATQWEYNPQFSPSPHDLILGHTNVGVCGALAKGLLEMVNLVAKCRGVANPCSLRSHDLRFVTIPYQWGFIDPGVQGNIESIQGGPNGYANVNRAFFIGHTWMEGLGHRYDPLGKQKDTDFRDAGYGDLQSAGPHPLHASNANWDLFKVNAAPPKAFIQGYEIRPHV